MAKQAVTFFDRIAAHRMLTDRFGRRISYLRISLTDRCNLRCYYCRPEAGRYRAEERGNLLSFEEIARIVRVAARLGVRKLRMTGGEPLVRRDVPKLIAMLASIDGIEEIAMTTNATLLAPQAEALARAGLGRINISLDTLCAARFRRLTGGEIEAVLDGIDAARKVGLSPIKINCVLMRGINDQEVAALMDFAAEQHATIRFIELMPMREGLDWKRYFIAADEVLAQKEVRARLRLDAPLHRDPKEPARYWPRVDGRGIVGFITPMSARFCAGCNRMRLTADGMLRPCLPAEHQVSLRALLRGGAGDGAIEAAFRRAAWIKPEIGVYQQGHWRDGRSMIGIGG